MPIDGHAVVYCEGAFHSTYGKTAHGLARFTARYNIVAIIDSTLSGCDSGEFLDGTPNEIPIVGSLEEAFRISNDEEIGLSYFVIGIATDGGYLTPEIKKAVVEALESGLNVDSGLHDFLSDQVDIASLAKSNNLEIRDIRKSNKSNNHIFSGKIEEVRSTKIAMLGTDSAIGKRTTAWLITNALIQIGYSSELIGTGQTSWMQGAEYSLVMDSLLNDYVSGELEHLLWQAWKDKQMNFAIIEGQGSLMNPAYPGGFEILAACRPDGIILQHAPARKEYDGFPGYKLDPIEDQIHIIEFLSKKPVLAITVNHENIPYDMIDSECIKLEKKLGIPVVDPIVEGVERLLPLLRDLHNEN